MIYTNSTKKLHEHWYKKISSLRCVEDRNPPQMHQTCIWNTGHMQSIASPVHASAVWTDEKKKTKKKKKKKH